MKKLTRQELIEWRDKVADDMRKAVSETKMDRYDELNTLWQKLDRKIRSTKWKINHKP